MRPPKNDIESAIVEAGYGINIKQNQEIIINSKNSHYVYDFALSVKESDTNKLQQVIIDNQDSYYAYLFALYVKNADVQKLANVVLDSQNKIHIKWFYKEVPHNKFDFDKFETYLTFM